MLKTQNKVTNYITITYHRTKKKWGKEGNFRIMIEEEENLLMKDQMSAKSFCPLLFRQIVHV